MSLIVLQELSPEYSDALIEGLHQLLIAATENRHYGDVSLLSAALNSLRAEKNVTEICYRNGEDLKPPTDIDTMSIYVCKSLNDLSQGSEITSYEILRRVEEFLSAHKPEVLTYKSKHAREFWKVCLEKSLECLLETGSLAKTSRYKYVVGEMPCYEQ